ncbi:hypothetical protein [Nocardia sp. CS682]|uniref:hypothetical protein n=1 Tax=Nocardia sp. CS682 TaxID=1047172 RepID=UPI001075375C|nr:hypothetical protein [Nocardia sp. CS682]QBS43562.1 hypothetical protein DMB37_29125 [Nocardia sp. CS682]
MSVPTPTDPFEGLDPFVQQALVAWQSLTAEQRDYAMGFMSAWAPDVVISAAAKSVDITAVDQQLMELEVRP